MRNFKVLVSALSCRGNKIFRAPNVITEAHLIAGNIDSLIENGFIEEISDSVKEPVKEPVSDSGNNPVFTTESGKEVFEVSDATKKEIISELESQEIEFDSKDSKSVLFQKL